MTQAYAKEKKMPTKKVVSFLIKKIGYDTVVSLGNLW